MGKRLKIEFYFDVFEKESELEEGWLDLLKAAESACDQAYAPYSNFTVGAALRLEDGSLIIGTNQENGAPAGIRCLRGPSCIAPKIERLNVPVRLAGRRSSFVHFFELLLGLVDLQF